MADAPEIVLIDAIAADIEANVPLTPTPQFVFRYRRPRAIMPDMCPALVIWVNDEAPVRATTVRFDYNISVGLSWHEETVEEAEDLVNDDAKSKSLLNNLSLLKLRVHYWAVNDLTGGPDEVWEVLPGGVEYFTGPFDDALVEGYSVEVLSQITQE